MCATQEKVKTTFFLNFLNFFFWNFFSFASSCSCRKFEKKKNQKSLKDVPNYDFCVPLHLMKSPRLVTRVTYYLLRTKYFHRHKQGRQLGLENCLGQCDSEQKSK